MNEKKVMGAYTTTRERYSQLGVDTDKALKALEKISISLPCWQGDDVSGFEKSAAKAGGGGIQATGNYPGRARTSDELRMDLKKAFSLIPGRMRLNLHAIYGEFGEKFVDRDKISPEHYKGWIGWAKQEKVNLDFNATCFAHPKAESGYTLSSKDKGIREFWIEHVKAGRSVPLSAGSWGASASITSGSRMGPRIFRSTAGHTAPC